MSEEEKQASNHASGERREEGWRQASYKKEEGREKARKRGSKWMREAGRVVANKGGNEGGLLQALEKVTHVVWAWRAVSDLTSWRWETRRVRREERKQETVNSEWVEERRRTEPASEWRKKPASKRMNKCVREETIVWLWGKKSSGWVNVGGGGRKQNKWGVSEGANKRVSEWGSKRMSKKWFNQIKKNIFYIGLD